MLFLYFNQGNGICLPFTLEISEDTSFVTMEKILRNRSLVDQFGLSPNVEVDRFYIIWFIINLYFYL